jgi:ribosomal protein S18 acetylase RimI-like enzyme
MAIKSLKIPCPPYYKKKDKREHLLNILDKYIESIAIKEYSKTRREGIKASKGKIIDKELKTIIDKEWKKLSEKDKKPFYAHENHLYTKEEIRKLDDDDLRRVIYFTHDKKTKTINGLCTEIEKWFRSKEWKGFDMLIPDKEAGTAGGHIKKTKTDKKTKRVLRIEKLIPRDDPEKFKGYMKNIEKLMIECFKVKKYKPEIDDKQWVFVFSRKKMVAILTVDKKNVIWNVCVSKNYRAMGVARQAINQAVEDVCTRKNPLLLVDNRGKTYNKLIKLYKSYGFTVIKDDGKYTTMEFKCDV